MSFFAKLFGRNRPEPPEAARPEPLPAQTQAEPNQGQVLQRDDDITKLSSVGQPLGPSEAEAERLLGRALASAHQRNAIDAIAHAMTHGTVPERLRVQCAQALVSRGDAKRALTLLDPVTGEASLMLKADLLHDEGQVARAVSVIERVMARNIDTPGARERHARWRKLLAPRMSRPRASVDVTMAVPTVQQSPFRIVREVARGGAGTIYEARDEVLGRKLALKVYHHAAADKAQIRRETQVATRFAGPGVINVFDADYAQGWIALEWLPSGSLREVINRSLINGSVLSELGNPDAFLRNLAHALSRIHADGWVHADIKPANVLLRAPETPVLSDFGIAVRSEESSHGGSAGFLSPERLEGGPLNAADDVYGFGRIVEDLAQAAQGSWDRLLPLAERCMSPRESRPEDGSALLALLRY